MGSNDQEYNMKGQNGSIKTGQIWKSEVKSNVCSYVHLGIYNVLCIYKKCKNIHDACPWVKEQART